MCLLAVNCIDRGEKAYKFRVESFLVGERIE